MSTMEGAEQTIENTEPAIDIPEVVKSIFTTTTGGVIIMVALCYFINMIDRNVVSVAAPAIKHEFGLSNTGLGLAFSVFGIAYLLQAPVGWLCDKWGSRLGLSVFGAIWSGATFACGLAGSLGMLVGARAVLGLGEAAPFPAMTRVIADWTPPSRRSFMQGLTHAFVSIGTTVCPPLVAWLMGYVGWRGAFIMLGVVSALWVVVWAWKFRDDPRSCPSVTQEELSQLVFSRKAHAQVPWGRLIRSMLIPAIIYMCITSTLWTFWTWLPSYFAKSYHLVLRDSAIFTFAVLFAGIFGDILGGFLSDTIRRRARSVRLGRAGFVALMILGAITCIGPVLFLRNLSLAATALGAGFFFIRASISPMWAVCTDIAPEWAGAAGGILNTGSAISAIAAPLVFGYLADLTGNYSIPFSGTLTLLALGLVLCTVMRPDRPLRETA